MASITKMPKGWRAQVFRKGQRRSKVFPTRQAAKDWAARTEYELTHSAEVAAALTLGEVFDRYAREVSPTKRGQRWETIRLEKFQRDSIARVRLGDLSKNDFTEWRDARLREVQPSSVRREMILMSAVLTVARRDWGLISTNPMADVRKPSNPAARDRLPTEDEIERLRVSAGEDLTKSTARAFHAFLFALETAMRAGEIAHLQWDRVDLEARVAHLDKTKNGTARDVPLSSGAVRLLEELPKLSPVFGLTPASLSALFMKIRNRAGVEGLTFHDSRAAAITQLSKKLEVLDLARMTGHKDLNMLIRVYYRESAASIARRLD